MSGRRLGYPFDRRLDGPKSWSDLLDGREFFDIVGNQRTTAH